MKKSNFLFAVILIIVLFGVLQLLMPGEKIGAYLGLQAKKKTLHLTADLVQDTFMQLKSVPSNKKSHQAEKSVTDIKKEFETQSGPSALPQFKNLENGFYHLSEAQMRSEILKLDQKMDFYADKKYTEMSSSELDHYQTWQRQKTVLLKLLIRQRWQSEIL